MGSRAPAAALPGTDRPSRQLSRQCRRCAAHGRADRRGARAYGSGADLSVPADTLRRRAARDAGTDPHGAERDRRRPAWQALRQRICDRSRRGVGPAGTRRRADAPSRWLISDRSFLRPALRWYARYDPDWLVRAPTVAALAERIGVPRGALTATVERFNGLCAAGRDEDFHRGETIFQKAKAKKRPMLSPIQKAPFVAMPFNRCILTTKGGLRTNAEAQVLRQDGSVIAG